MVMVAIFSALVSSDAFDVSVRAERKTVVVKHC